jgi:twitching motility protein PilT
MNLDQLLERTVQMGASDLHLKYGAPPVARIDGRLAPLGDQRLGGEALTAMMSEVTARSPAKRTEFDQTGEVDTVCVSSGGTRFRVNGFRQRGCISLAFRRVAAIAPTLGELLMPEGVHTLASERHGLVLVTGATGSGKSTTLAAVVDHINSTRSCHVVTLEDPIELMHTDRRSLISQREIGVDTASFAQALRRVLRQDPDVILIGELRDAESAEAALHAAESGHLVLSTMHTIGAVETVDRMTDFFPPTQESMVRNILAGVLRGSISQRLLPRPAGGRVAAVEVMINTARVRDLIRDPGRTPEMADAIAEGTVHGMQSFDQHLIELVMTGMVAAETAAAAASDVHDFALALERALKERRAARQEAAATADDAPGDGDEPKAADIDLGNLTFDLGLDAGTLRLAD